MFFEVVKCNFHRPEFSRATCVSRALPYVTSVTTVRFLRIKKEKNRANEHEEIDALVLAKNDLSRGLDSMEEGFYKEVRKKEEEEEEVKEEKKKRINRRDGRKWRRNALNLSRSSNPRGDSKSIDTKFAKIGPRSGMRRP